MRRCYIPPSAGVVYCVPGSWASVRCQSNEAPSKEMRMTRCGRYAEASFKNRGHTKDRVAVTMNGCCWSHRDWGLPPVLTTASGLHSSERLAGARRRRRLSGRTTATPWRGPKVAKVIGDLTSGQTNYPSLTRGSHRTSAYLCSKKSTLGWGSLLSGRTCIGHGFRVVLETGKTGTAPHVQASEVELQTLNMMAKWG